MSLESRLLAVCAEIVNDIKQLKAWSTACDPTLGQTLTSQLIQHTVKELFAEANQLDPVKNKPLIDAAACVKQATLNLLKEYRAIEKTNLEPFNSGLRDLVIQIKAFDSLLRPKTNDSSTSTQQPVKIVKTETSTSSPLSTSVGMLSNSGNTREEINKIKENIKETLKQINANHDNGDFSPNIKLISILQEQVDSISKLIGTKNETLQNQVETISKLSSDPDANLAPTLREMYLSLRDLEKGLKKS